MRLLPAPGCRPTDEGWHTAFDVGGVFRSRPGSGIDNPTTQFDRANPERLIFSKPSVCGQHDAGR